MMKTVEGHTDPAEVLTTEDTTALVMATMVAATAEVEVDLEGASLTILSLHAARHRNPTVAH